MTYNQIFQKFRETVVVSAIEDYRPDVSVHTKGIKSLPEGAGIIIWMKNGDSILYYPSEILGKTVRND